MKKVKDHSVKVSVGEIGEGGFKFGTIDECKSRMKGLAEEMGIDFEQYKRLWFLVNDNGVPMVVETTRVIDLNGIDKVLERNGIAPIIAHSLWFTEVGLRCRYEKNDEYVRIRDRFSQDATKGRSPEDVVRDIINNANGITQIS